jgi:hypothetical protein
MGNSAVRFSAVKRLSPCYSKIGNPNDSSRKMAGIFQFQKHYSFLAVLLFVIEVLIAVYIHDRVIRPYLGDYLVVMMLYCFLRSFIKISVFPACILVLLFSYLVELVQYFHLVEILGLQHSTLVTTVLGNSFEWIDLIAYSAGIATVLFIERVRKQASRVKENEIMRH